LGYWKSFQNKLAKKTFQSAGNLSKGLSVARVRTDTANQDHAKLVVAIASRALFDLDESHQIFETQGAEVYARYQIENEEIPLAPGVAFPLVCKLLALNKDGQHRVEVTLVSRNSADTGLRIFNSIRHHGLDITRAAFTRGESPYRYISAFGAHLFLSASQEDVQKALHAGIAAATIMPSATGSDVDGQLRIAFDGDAVLFSDEAERVFAESGLEAFNRTETEAKDRPLPGGPFKPFLAALHKIQSEYDTDNSPIRTALVTARGAPAHERVIRTLRSWGIRIDEALFLGGMDKGIFLQSFGADIFFDDQRKHCESAAGYVATGHVPYGVKNA
jgi:5'-nucleotidase